MRIVLLCEVLTRNGTGQKNFKKKLKKQKKAYKKLKGMDANPELVF